METIKNEPGLVAQLIGLITAVIAVGVSLNIFELSVDQVAAIVDNLPALVGGVLLVFGGGAALVARNFTYSTNKIGKSKSE